MRYHTLWFAGSNEIRDDSMYFNAEYGLREIEEGIIGLLSTSG